MRVPSEQTSSPGVLRKIIRMAAKDALLILLGVKSAALPNVSCEYEVSDLNAEAITGRARRALRYSPWS